MKVLLNTNGEFKLVPQGEVVLKVAKATAVPSGKPEKIEIEYVDVNGAKIVSTYNLKDEKGVKVFSILVNKILGNLTEFDTDNIHDLENKYVLCEITHKLVQSTKDPDKTLTFCNIAKFIEGRTGFPQATVPTTEVSDDLA